MPLDEIYTKFESLGNNCELGIVQRRSGYDAPGLFRNVGYLNVLQIVKALTVNLDTMFDLGAFSFLHREGWPDWVLHCDRFGFAFHSGIPAHIDRGGLEWERYSGKCIASFLFMKRKFQEDLSNGTKCFVFRSREALEGAEIDRLHLAIGACGPGWLLYVREDDLIPAGSVRLIRDRLLVASVARLSNENPPQIEFLSWEKIARKALAIRYGGRGFPGMWQSPNAETNLVLDVPPPSEGLDVLEHSILPHADGEPVFNYHRSDAHPDGTYTATCWVLVPDEFDAKSIGLAMLGYRSLRFKEIDLQRRGIWQRIWATTRIPSDRRGLAPSLIANGTSSGKKIYTAGWELIEGTSYDWAYNRVIPLGDRV